VRLTTAMKRLLLAVTVLLMACNPSGEPTTATSETTTTTAVTTTTSLPPTTVAPTTTSQSGCGASMDEERLGEMPSPDSDAEQLSTITWQTDEACERFLIAFTSAEGAPATTAPSLSGEFLRDSAILRIHFDVERTVVTDQLVQSGLVDRLYVVRPLQAVRTLFVDFHLSAPALASIAVTEGSGDVEILLETGGAPYDAVSSFGDNVVVVSPTPGPVELPLTVEGYSRNFEATTNVQVTQDGALILEDFTTAADWVETWGEYELTISPEASGPAELFVGEFSAQDGSPRGLVLDITLPG